MPPEVPTSKQTDKRLLRTIGSFLGESPQFTSLVSNMPGQGSATPFNSTQLSHSCRCGRFSNQLFFHLQPVEISVIGLTSGLVLVMELLNTAIESVVDLTVKQSYHELAKIARTVLLVLYLFRLRASGSWVLPLLLLIQSALS